MENISQSLFAVSEVELIYRNKVKPNDRPKIGSPANAYDILLSAWDMNKIEMVEQFYVLLLDRGQHCLGVSNSFTGGVSACLIDPKIVFATALKANASGIVIAHNHPSGILKPSAADDLLTKKLKAGGDFLEIPLKDHLIVSPHNYYSYAENGLIL